MAIFKQGERLRFTTDWPPYANGQIVWDVPEDFTRPEVDVYIQATVPVTKKKSATAEQRFRLVVPPKP